MNRGSHLWRHLEHDRGLMYRLYEPFIRYLCTNWSKTTLILSQLYFWFTDLCAKLLHVNCFIDWRKSFFSWSFCLSRLQWQKQSGEMWLKDSRKGGNFHIALRQSTENISRFFPQGTVGVLLGTTSPVFLSCWFTVQIFVCQFWHSGKSVWWGPLCPLRSSKGNGPKGFKYASSWTTARHRYWDALHVHCGSGLRSPHRFNEAISF